MRSKLLLLSFSFVLFLVIAVSCGSKPETVAPDPGRQVNAQTPVMVPIVPAEAFDPARITQAYYEATREEVRQFIERLNRDIRNKNYNAWRAALSAGYFAEISSPEELRRISELPAMKTRNIVLRNAQDYFEHVVVPSRANSRVDDIEFISMNRVKAFTINTNRAGEEVRLRLYDLEKINNTWTIIN